jgi:aminoglycoside 6-adenylyltransferase
MVAPSAGVRAHPRGARIKALATAVGLGVMAQRVTTTYPGIGWRLTLPRSVGVSEFSSSSVRATDYLDRFVARCRDVRSIRGVILLGSAASEGEVDPLSDLDLMVITNQRRRFSSPEWLDLVAPPPLFSWTYRSPVGGQMVRQAIYEGLLVVDIAFVSSIQALLLGMAVTAFSRFPALRRRVPLSLTMQLGAWFAITGRGTKVLLDKQGVAKRMTASAVGNRPRLPAQNEYNDTVFSLFGLILWESKQLVRNELWMALGSVDQQVKQCLLTMMEWHSLATNPQLRETWYGGRRVEQWADPRWVAHLRQTWPSYDVEGAWEALFATLELFSEVARETAQVLGHRYPVDEELRLRGWITARRPGTPSDA